jgi:hypothetical protein
VPDERQCRLCLVTGDTDDNRLFSPCLCNGTQQYIHEECLEAWREKTANTSYYFECPVCSYQYRLSRISCYHLIVHWTLVVVATLLSATLTVVVDAYAWKLVIRVAGGTPYGMDDATPPLQLSGELILLAMFTLGWMVVLWELAHAERGQVNGGGGGFGSFAHGAELFVVLVAIVGFLYGLHVMFWAFHQLSRRLLRAAGDRVLEIKKNV